MKAIEVNNVSKYFKGAKALEEVSFPLKKGEKLIVLGPNGAGKSTLLRLISGILKPDKGFIKVLGSNTIENPKEMRMKISFVGENYSLYDNLSVMENLIFFGRLYGLDKEEIEEKVEYNLERLNAANYKYTKVGQLSRGTKQKIAICRALLNNPEVMLLDEPTAFLDPKASKEVHEIINSSKATIVYATQRLEEIHKIDGKVLILKKGRVEGFGNIDEILSKIKNVKVEVYLLESKKLLINGFKILQKGNRIEAELDSAKEIPELISKIIEKGGKILSVSYLNESISEGW